MKHSLTAAFAAVLVFAPAAAHAADRVWTISGVTFNDGGSASGTFTYDAFTNTYSNIAITTTVGSVRSGDFYDSKTGESPRANGVFARTTDGDNTGLGGLYLFLNENLTGTSTVATIGVLNEGSCVDAVCNSINSPLRPAYSGQVTADPVPVPGVTSVVPGSALAGATVTVTGSDLNFVDTVVVGGASATFTVISPTELQFIVPAGGSGAGRVVVTSAAGSSADVAGDEFTYLAPPPPPVPTPVPTLSEWALILLGGLLAAAATLRLRERKTLA